MVRQLLVPALSALALAPLTAPAQYPCVCPPVYLPPCPPTVIYVAGPAVGCVPTAGAVAPQKPPTVVPERMDPPKKPEVSAEPPKEMPAKAEAPAEPKAAEPGPIKPIEPAKVPEVKPVEPIPFKPVPPAADERKVVPPTTGADRIPTPAVPPTPPAKGDIKKMDFEVPPLGDVPPAKPVPAEPTPAKPEPPKGTAEKPADKPKGAEKVPEFDFDLPKVDNAQPVEANKKTVANSSPLADRAVVEVFPRDGKDVMTATRGVTFVNKSARDILLTVDGKTTTLGSKTVLRVDLPVKFEWQIGGEPARTEKVPDGSPGIDVVIRK